MGEKKVQNKHIPDKEWERYSDILLFLWACRMHRVIFDVSCTDIIDPFINYHHGIERGNYL